MEQGEAVWNMERTGGEKVGKDEARGGLGRKDRTRLNGEGREGEGVTGEQRLGQVKRRWAKEW